jgi:hypothetical protein
MNMTALRAYQDLVRHQTVEALSSIRSAITVTCSGLVSKVDDDRFLGVKGKEKLAVAEAMSSFSGELKSRYNVYPTLSFFGCKARSSVSFCGRRQSILWSNGTIYSAYQPTFPYPTI